MLKRARRIFVFLRLGAIVNVAVAWGCAIWHGQFRASPFRAYHRDGFESPRLVFTHSRFGYRIVIDDDVDGPMLRARTLLSPSNPTTAIEAARRRVR